MTIAATSDWPIVVVVHDEWVETGNEEASHEDRPWESKIVVPFPRRQSNRLESKDPDLTWHRTMTKRNTAETS